MNPTFDCGASADLLFSAGARARFVDPDLEAIPRYDR